MVFRLVRVGALFFVQKKLNPAVFSPKSATFAVVKRWLGLFLFLLLTLPTCGQQHRSSTADDVLQHVPMATVFALKVCGLQSKGGANGDSQWGELALTAAASYAVATAVTWSAKQLVNERRPDGSDCRSFPSGHATYAFAGATMLRHEYGHLSPWVTVGGYGLAVLVAADRVRLDRHYIHDVCAGAAVGVAATELTYLLKRKLMRSQAVDVSITGSSLAFRYTF